LKEQVKDFSSHAWNDEKKFSQSTKLIIQQKECQKNICQEFLRVGECVGKKIFSGEGRKFLL